MCPGNRAAATTTWVNGQLELLWTLSRECAEKHGLGLRSSRQDITHGTCLAQFGFGKHLNKPVTEDLHFFSSFTAPTLTFICNHDVLVQFHLEKGHFKHENRGSIDHFHHYTCAFRVPFRVHTITDTTLFSTGQVDTCKAKFLILDLDRAVWVREHSAFEQSLKTDFDEVDRKQRAIVKFLQFEYLPLLRKSGFHYIQSLPDFDNLPRSHHIDWSVITTIEIDTYSVFDINIDVINTYLKGRWLEAAGCIDELDDDHDHSDFAEFALAEHRAACDDFHFHAFFGPPQIRALCGREVVFFVDVQDLHFHLHGDTKGEAHHRFSNWKIAIIIDVDLIEEDHGYVKRLKLNVLKARFCETLSFFGEIEESLFHLRSSFIGYIVTRYLTILEEHHHNHIYRIDVRVEEEGEDDEFDDEDWPLDEYRESLRITDTFGFDIVTATSQSSINYHLRCLWKASQAAKSILSYWSLDDYFNASFGAPQIQLPSGGGPDSSVYLYLTLQEGSLTLLDRFKDRVSGDKRHGFSSWRLAFEIKLRRREYKNPDSDGYLKGHKNVGDYVNHQLYLDFETAKFRQDLSRLPGLLDDTQYLLMRYKRQALIYYVTKIYFGQLQKQGLHILFNIPIWKTRGSSGITPFAPSWFSHQFYSDSKTAVSSLFGRHRAFGNRNLIVIFGMLDGQKGVHFPPDFPWHWHSAEDPFSGTVSLSHKIVLKDWLLVEFANINRRTTIIPVFKGVEDFGKWIFSLETLEEHRHRRREKTHFSGHGSHLEYLHHHKDLWTFEHRSDCDDQHNGFYSVSAETKNTLFIPTVRKNKTLEIVITGQVELQLEFKGGQKAWSNNGVVKWSSSIIVSNAGHGYGLKITNSTSKDFTHGVGFCGDEIADPLMRDAHKLLRDKFEKLVIVDKKIIQKFETLFGNVWPLFYSGAHGYTLSNAVFNSSGDLLFDLESPVDYKGQLRTPGRDDIADVVKRPAVRSSSSFFGRIGEAISSTLQGDSSIVTASTGLDSPLKTPPSNRITLQSQPRVATVDAYPEGEDQEDLVDEDIEPQEPKVPKYVDQEFDFDRASGLVA